jgi:HPt (histidine-containing phosphotransfer) domain-containing protein
MDDYMSKPIRAADLDATLLRWIGVDRRSPNAGPDAGPDSGPDAGPNAGSGVPAPRRSPVEERLVELSGDRSPEEVELVRSIALSFLGRVPDLLSRLDEALTGADAEDGHRLAHSLKGAAANMGADAVASVCQQIEDLAEQGRHRDALEHRAELTELLAQTCDEIGRYLAESTPAP